MFENDISLRLQIIAMNNSFALLTFFGNLFNVSVFFSSISGGTGINRDFSTVSKMPRAVRSATSKVPSTEEERHALFHKSSREYD